MSSIYRKKDKNSERDMTVSLDNDLLITAEIEIKKVKFSIFE